MNGTEEILSRQVDTIRGHLLIRLLQSPAELPASLGSSLHGSAVLPQNAHFPHDLNLHFRKP